MKDLTLLIMAAGMGSRFGGLKQMEPVGPNNEFIIDYSIYDAKIAGFNKVVFVIKEENYEEFKNTIGSRIESHIKVEYCFQKMGKLPNNYHCEITRKKPWGTAHAIWSAKYNINENFAIINADDFYGREAFLDMANYLKNMNDVNEYALIGYDADKTLTKNGSVKRAILKENNGYLQKLTESNIEMKNDKVYAKELDSDVEYIIPNNTPVSLNMFGFNPSIFEYIEEYFMDFIGEGNLETSEYLIPNLVSSLIEKNKVKVKLIPTKSEWTGVTYRTDLDDVIIKINSEIAMGRYNKKLWE